MSAPSFFADAECRGMDTWFFYPWSPDSRPSPLAVQACSRCGVREECLTYSITPPFEHGFWGGMTEPERIVERVRRYSQEQTERRRAARKAAAAERQEEVAA